ncbi:sensor histidine kinase [Lactonifactor longoviformis]|uniref:sensor histidine kinase n=1 Tax=Lactonifactor longoviformis TaxID=341220 RepID=UPI001D01547E|nr:sensor histidine kinase [Lactonifactor longoviformis]MCB5711633.1 sensor histidine kinase [Lactonifactor longoviformis]MCB5715600.1 sensor histidine kinase [Lactonifactor longoviformis]
MSFFRYCRDRWLSVLIFVFVFAAGGGILWLIGTPFAVACVVEGFYAAGFFLILLQGFLARKAFYDKLLEASDNLEEISYLSEFLTEPHFLEGAILYCILQKDEKYLNDRIAAYQRDLQEYMDYVETWVHEVKTPIAVSRLIMENNRNEVTRSLSEEMDKVEGFVNQMLYYSKSGSLQDDYQIRRVSLRTLVVEAVKHNAKYMIAQQVAPKFGDLDYEVLTDPKWMDFVLGQIISNGVKYRSAERSSEIAFSAVQTGRTVTLSIEDNGIGIPAEDLGRIFRKGFSGVNGRKYGKSTGMGLYLCDTLCRKLGTDLSVSSREEEGSIFELKLTLASEKETGLV